MAAVTLENLTKTYRSLRFHVRAVHRLDLQIEDGELMVLVGPSGSGKTTLLRLIAGLERATAGVIRIGERVVNDVDPKDRDVALVFQDFALYPHLSAFDNMAFGLRMRAAPKAEIDARVREAAAMLGITPLLSRKPGALSGGERQRVALGRAMVRRPAVFLLDEPLSNLDASLRRQMRGQIKSLHQALRTTTIYVTHDQEEALALGDRIAVLRGGVLEQCATPTELYNEPANPFVASFIGTPPINFIQGRIKTDGRRWFFACGLALFELPDRLRGRSEALGQTDAMLGVRPQYVRVAPARSTPSLDDASGQPSQGTAGQVEMMVEGIERLGHRTDLRLRHGAEICITAAVATPYDSAAGLTADAVVGKPVWVHFDLSTAQFFPIDETAGGTAKAK